MDDNINRLLTAVQRIGEALDMLGVEGLLAQVDAEYTASRVARDASFTTFSDHTERMLMLGNVFSMVTSARQLADDARRVAKDVEQSARQRRLVERANRRADEQLIHPIDATELDKFAKGEEPYPYPTPGAGT